MSGFLQLGGLRVDLDRQLVIRPDGSEVRPRPQSFAVLLHLASNVGRIVSRNELADVVWPGIAVTDDSVVQCVADLRRAFGPNGRDMLRTLPKRGYLLEVAGSANGAAGAPEELSPRPAEPLRPSIAVLAFRALGGAPLEKSLCEGVAEDLIVELSRNPHLAVVARQSSFRFDPTAGPQEVCRALRVRFLVAGSVRVVGDRLRVAAHLVGADGSEIWAERYDRALALTELFEVQTEIARTVTGTVAGRIDSADAPLVTQRPEGLAAYQLVLEGLRSMHRYTRDGLDAAREAFRAAIVAEPGYARAHGLLAMTEIYLPWYYGIDTDVSAAVAPAMRAVELDARDPKGHCALGITRMMAGDHARAREHFETGLRMNGNDDLLLIEYGRFLMYDDRAEQGLASVAEAMRLNPFHPNWYWNIEGRCLHTLGRYGAAIAAFERVVNPPFWTHAYLASCAAMLGQTDRAAEYCDRLMAARPDFSLARFARIFPYRNPATAARFLGSLQAAGVP